MDERLLKKLEEKIQETISNKHEIKQIIETLSYVDDSRSFAFGILMGRLYNSFYYQSKRIQNREPNKDDFDEFLEIIKKQKTELEKLCS